MLPILVTAIFHADQEWLHLAGNFGGLFCSVGFAAQLENIKRQFLSKKAVAESTNLDGAGIWL